MQEKNTDPSSMDADHVRRLTQIGVALSAEKNIDRLLEKILTEARTITSADGGTLYLMSENERELQFAFIQNESMGVTMGGTGEKITWPPVPMTGADGLPNHANVSAHVAITREAVNIEDVYDASGFNFDGPRAFDQKTGYRTKSMLVVPMLNHENEIIGVLQMINARNKDTGLVIPFSERARDLAWSLASQAAVALTNNLLILELQTLLEAFIQTIALAIDEKSPYTGGHVRRVAGLTMQIAEAVNACRDGHYANTRLSEDEMRELRMAAWLHDVGKITTPDHVVDKATKLEKVYDRIGEIKTRFEVLKRDRLLAACGGRENPPGANKAETERELDELDDERRFLLLMNIGGEFTKDQMIERIRRIAQRQWKSDGEVRPLLTEDEVYNLSIRRGTLNDEEREIINNHAALTHKMLSKLPFPKKLRRISEYAGAHHEKLDGSGYPLGLKGDELSLQSRIIALADIFEALTAKDRPYKKGKTLGEALKIMEMMVKDHHIDANLYELFIREKIYMAYAAKELASQQIDV
jgi:HD-GYP domain-containing protein (c-di-GMP phosphodiesterase class II)